MTFVFDAMNETNFLVYRSWFVSQEIRRWIEVPSLVWLQYVMHTPGIYGWMVYKDGIPLAQLQLDTDATKTGYVGIIVNPDCHNQGLGKAILQVFLERNEVKSLSRIVAAIETDNTASLRCFASAGFVAQSPKPDADGFLHFVYEVP